MEIFVAIFIVICYALHYKKKIKIFLRFFNILFYVMVSFMEPKKRYARRGTPDSPIAISLVQKKLPYLDKLHFHTDIELIYVCVGEAIYQVDNKNISLSSGDVLILTPGQTHRCIHVVDDSRIWILCFPPELVRSWEGNVLQQDFVKPLQEGLLQLPQLLREGHPAYQQVMLALQWLPYCSNMLKPNYKALRYTMAVGICSALMPWCTKAEVPLGALDSDNTAIQQAMYFIRLNHLKQISLKDIADYAHLHPNYLCALCKKHTGQTVMYHLDRTRVDTAIHLLENSRLTLDQIAAHSGYRNEGAFYYKFKKFTGTTPNQWRRRAVPGIGIF